MSQKNIRDIWKGEREKNKSDPTMPSLFTFIIQAEESSSFQYFISFYFMKTKSSDRKTTVSNSWLWQTKNLHKCLQCLQPKNKKK